MSYFYTSDLHFNHGDIIKCCDRPFTTVEKMNLVIIRNWNQRVKDSDTVFVIGDFIFKNSLGGKTGAGLPQKAEFFLKQLKGNKICIKGNHDRNNSLKTPIEKIIIKYGGKRICLVHNPIHADSKCELNLVGHIHNLWKIKRLSNKSVMVNVGVDCWNFMPVKLEEVFRAINNWKKKELKGK